ncbi:MAG TPA: fatty acid desaturase, partial [Rudaea sp.]
MTTRHDAATLPVRNPAKSPATKTPIPAGANLAIGLVLASLHILALIVLPLAGVATVLRIGALALIALCSPMLWGLIHEAIHGLLFASRRANDIGGRLLAILFCVPFRAVRFAHLRHHRYSRTPLGSEEVYDPQRTSHLAAFAFHFVRLTFGLYLGEVLLCLFCWLPRPLL